MVFKGGGNAGGADSTAAPPSVQADSGRRTQTLANRDTGTVRNPAGTTGGPAPVDSAAIDRQLGEIVDLVDPATIRRRAGAIYGNERAPKTLRAQAGFMVAQAFFQQQRSDEACRWTDSALRLTPANETYLRFKRDQRCT